jgi:hypothetical protein
MTIEEFRSYGGLVEPPQIFFPIGKQVQPIFSSNGVGDVVMKQIVSTGGGGTAKLRAIETSTGQQDSLRLKRDKPLARAASKLESSLGIVRKSK